MTIKTTINISLVLVLMTACSARSQKPIEYSLLAIEYVGESDKPVFPIVISDSQVGISWYRDAVLKGDESKLIHVHVINVSLMARLIADAEKHRAEQVLANQSKPRETVSITLVTSQARNTFLLNTKSAVSLLEDLKKLSTADKSLQADISHFMSRISSLERG